MLRTVNIRELKDRLSAYLRDAQRGDVFLVTDRGRVVAELRTPGASSAAQDVTSDDERRLMESGGLKMGLPNRPDVYRSTGVTVASDEITAALDFIRGDR